MARVSPDLMWHCVKTTSCFLRKSTNNPDFSAEKGNLLGMNRFSNNGLVGKKVLDIRPEKHGKKELITMITRSSRASRMRMPKLFHVKTGIEKCHKKGIKQIDRLTEKFFYRPDLLELAKAKYAKVRTSFKKNKSVKAAKAAK
mmetsp:Transcript_23008/g.52683  ORF Transcript_23008/g.52683 Transcript_23008/m.52683 type:complete len:143 (+) Transcript_23008:77-505(+)|eukprot:CAMPEP_0197885740 /NCGR_PEP_ID=MMETSP1439-20131203/14660_1 /TAXON_ID=66791 /ORGANISM="Gonyaulax spinifera, Strain CCMP409" /LENGTH=142 /DNA_ID=CAMNT_0043505493 /DNA_START=76 /DNA_END=504 /DNA_ORIENTATION=-